MRKDILVIGAGWIGRKIAEGLDCELSDIRIKRDISLETALWGKDVKILINAVGVSGKTSIGWCEDHKDETYFGNVHVPYLMKKLCESKGVKLVHLSSCYVDYDNSFYSLTKKMAEEILKSYDDTLICRINLPMDSEPHPRNLLDKLLGYDQITSKKAPITVLEDFISALGEMIAQDRKDVVNCVNEGSISPWEIIDIYEKVVGKNLNKVFIKDTMNIDIPPDIKMPNVQNSVLKQIQKYTKITK